MLTAHQISKSYGINPILYNITFTINAGDRVGLIGPNGCGKTTLLRILAGVEQADSGAIATVPRSLRIGYLAQGFEPEPGLTLGQIVAQAAGDQAQLEADVARLALALAAEPLPAGWQEAYDLALERLSRHDPGRAPALLAALGLANVPAGTPAANLSGGQKTRLSLALVLLNDPELLLLDEPTNHLDIAMLEWLEEWLAAFPGGALIVSHDRTFLDRTTSRILDLNPDTHRVREYEGNYSDYLEQFQQEQAHQWAQWRDQVYEIRRMKQDIAHTKEQARSVERTTTPGQPYVRRLAKKVAKKAKGREKKLERYLESDERVEKPARHWQVKLDFDAGTHLGQHVLTLEDVAVGYDKPLLSGLNFQIQAGQRVVLTGENGVGKTTLLRTIAGELPPLAGRVRLGGSVRLGYMAQEQGMLDSTLTPLQMVQQVAAMNETEARSYLHFYLFTGDDALRPVQQLSYGERARLMLACLIAQGCNFLLLDEPINHLDIPSRTLFEQALSQFEGTVLAVVHDRYFIERFATDVYRLVGIQLSDCPVFT